MPFQSALARFADFVHEPRGLARSASWLLIASLIAAVAWLVYATGGTVYVYAHTIYIPILFAALVFRVQGALLAALVSGIVLGPWMPLEVATGTPQTTINWIYRIGMLSLVAVTAGVLFQFLHGQLDRLRTIAYRDVETGLPNQLSLEQSVRRALADASGSGQANRRVFVASVQLVNYDELINTIGISVSRGLLYDIASGLKDIAGDKASVFRVFTDSFAFVMEGVTRRDCFRLVADAVDTIEAPRQLQRMPVYMEACVGIAAFPYHESDDANMLIRKSVMALGEARAQGKTRTTYDRRMDDTRKVTTELLGALKPAMEQGELELHYQPKLVLRDGSISGVEALLRWNRDTGMVPPGAFIGAAERCGLIHPLTRWVVEAALEQLAAWRVEGLTVPVAVNISGRNLLDDGFLPWVRRLLEMHRIEPGELVFELTENSLYAEVKGGIEQLNTLRALGVGLSIDDFGSGYSSLANLRSLPVDELKIDRSFVSRMTAEAIDADIIAGSVRLAHGLGMRTVAEGVEDAATGEALMRLECDIAQGYHYCRPLPAAQATEWIRAHAG